jgi:hypothetical protein
MVPTRFRTPSCRQVRDCKTLLSTFPSATRAHGNAPKLHVDEKTALDAYRDLTAECPQFFPRLADCRHPMFRAVRTNTVRTAFSARYRLCPSYCSRDASPSFVLRRSHPTTLQACRVPCCSGSRHVKLGLVAHAEDAVMNWLSSANRWRCGAIIVGEHARHPSLRGQSHAPFEVPSSQPETTRHHVRHIARASHRDA